jgi:hypothetical protein
MLRVGDGAVADLVVVAMEAGVVVAAGEVLAAVETPAVEARAATGNFSQQLSVISYQNSVDC